MPYTCCVSGCNSKGTMPERKFFRFPMLDNHTANSMNKSQLRQQAWFKAINKPNFLPRHFKYAKVCDKHFVSGRSARLHDTTNVDWIPTLNMGWSESSDYTEIDIVKMEFDSWDSDSKNDNNLLEDMGNNTKACDKHFVSGRSSCVQNTTSEDRIPTLNMCWSDPNTVKTEFDSWDSDSKNDNNLLEDISNESKRIVSQTFIEPTDCDAQTYDTYEILSVTDTYRPFQMRCSTQTQTHTSDAAEIQTDSKSFKTICTQTDEEFTKMSAQKILSLEDKIKTLEDKIKNLEGTISTFFSRECRYDTFLRNWNQLHITRDRQKCETNNFSKIFTSKLR